MDLYRDTLQHIIEISAKSYVVIILVILCALFFSFVLKNKFNTKKVSIALIAILILVCLSAGVVLVPKLADLKQNSFVTIENSKLVIGETNSTGSGGGAVRISGGYAYAYKSDGSSIQLVGVNFFELPSSEPNQEFYGDIVYAEHSRQLIAIEYRTSTLNFSDTEWYYGLYRHKDGVKVTVNG